MRSLVTLILMLLPRLAAAESWKLMQESEGVQVFMRQERGSKLVSMKGIGVIDAPIRTLALVFLDDEHLPQWTEDVDARVVRLLNQTEFIEYNHVKMPPLVADREFITNVTVAIDPERRSFVMVSQPTEESSIAITNRIRGELTASYEMQAIDATHSRLSITMHTDPKGMLPAWLVNYFAKDWALATMRGVRKQCARKDLKAPKEFVDLLAQLEFFPR